MQQSFKHNDAMKPSKLEDRLGRCYPDKIDKDLKCFRTLNDQVQNRPTVDNILASTSQKEDDDLRAFYDILPLLAKFGTPHTIN